MTPVGHSLMGLSIGVLCLPRATHPMRTVTTLATFILLASAPDIPLTGWGHNRYRISHSIFVTCALLAAALGFLVLRPRLRHWLGDWRVAFAGAACWVSHLLLDCLYNHGIGIALFWPFSDARLNLALPWFAVLGREGGPSAMSIYTVEGLFYGGILLACIAIRRRGRRASIEP
jgi:membrane-bound metal-dependent hydrolase YbcI (DUF457 family)